MAKVCVFCTELEFEYDPGGEGCPTCGYGGESSAEMRCAKGHWDTNIEDGLDTYRKKILRAESCDDYNMVNLDS